MDLVVDDLADDKKFFKRKFGSTEKNDLSDLMNLDSWDPDFVFYLNSRYSFSYDPLHEFSVEDGDDKEYALFLSRLKKDGYSYILEGDERIGLTEPLNYEDEEDEPDDVGQEDTNSPSKSERIEPIDSEYAFFTNNLRIRGPNLIFQGQSNQELVYDLQNFSKFQRDNGACCRKQMPIPSVKKEKSSSSSGEDRYRKHDNRKRKRFSKFRARIMRILRKPYDKEEHQQLWQDITTQKPQVKHIDLRSGCVRFIESERKGKSYLDHHGDLKRKVKEAAKDDNRQLNLLRGFFFWIKNLTQEGSFIPWTDEECLAVLPQAS